MSGKAKNYEMEDVKVAINGGWTAGNRVDVDESATLTNDAQSKRKRFILMISRRFIAPGVLLSLVMIFVIISVINLKALENLDTTVDDLFMDLRMSDPEMKVSFDMNNPSRMHELQIRGMTCDLLVYESEHDKHLLGKLVSDDESVSKPGRHRLSRETTLQQPDTDLLADLMAGRSQYTKADIDCVIKTVIKLWGQIPMKKNIHVVTKIGGTVAETTDDDGNANIGRDRESAGQDAVDNKLTARMVDYEISFPSVASAALDSTAEITFHDGHALGLLFRALVEETNTFTVHMPEAAYRMNTNFLGSITKTTDSTSDEKEEASNDNSNNNNNNPKRESSLEIKSIKLHAHNARVTKDDVDVQPAGDVVVRMPVTVEVSCESPDCMWVNLPAVLRAYKTVKDTFKENRPLDTIAEALQLHRRRMLLAHEDNNTYPDNNNTYPEYNNTYPDDNNNNNNTYPEYNNTYPDDNNNNTYPEYNNTYPEYDNTYPDDNNAYPEYHYTNFDNDEEGSVWDWLAEFFDSDSDDLVVDDYLGFTGELNLRFSFDDFMGNNGDQSNVGAKVIGKLDDLVFDASVHAAVNTKTHASGVYDGVMDTLLMTNGQAHNNTDISEFGLPWMPIFAAVTDLWEIEVRNATLGVSTSDDNMVTKNVSKTTLDEDFTLTLARADSPRPGLDSFLFATTSGLTLAPFALAPLEELIGDNFTFDLGGNYDNVALATAMGDDEFNLWFLTEAANPFFQTRWVRVLNETADVVILAAAMATSDHSGRARVTVTQENTSLSSADYNGTVDTIVHGVQNYNITTSFDLATTGVYETGTDYLNVTFAGDVLFFNGSRTESNTLAGGVNMTGGSLFRQDNNDAALDFGATGLLNVDADVYTMTLGLATGSAPRSDYNETRNGLCTDECTQSYFRTRNLTDIYMPGEVCNIYNVFGVNHSDYNPDTPGNRSFGSPSNWNASEACEYVPYHDYICTDGGFGSTSLDLNGQGSVYDGTYQSYPYAIGDRCALGTDCTDCSALELGYVDGYATGERVSASGNSTTMDAHFHVSTNVGDVNSGSPDLDFGASGSLDLDADVYTMSLDTTHARRESRDSNVDDGGRIETAVHWANGAKSFNWTTAASYESGLVYRNVNEEYLATRSDVCAEQCRYSNDGHCDDEGPGTYAYEQRGCTDCSPSPSVCGLGSDCADCSQLFGATVVDFANVTVASDLAYIGGSTNNSTNISTTLAGGVSLMGVGLFQNSTASDVTEFGATGHLNVDADVYTMSLGVVSGTHPRQDYDERRNNVCTDECPQLFLRNAWGSPCTFENSGYYNYNGANSSDDYRLWNISRDCEYVPDADGICTDGGLGASDQILRANEQGSVWDSHAMDGFPLRKQSNSSCALGTDCTDCSALSLSYANVTFAAEYVLASGDSSALGTNFALTTNSGENEFIDPLVHTELSLDAHIESGGDSVSVTVALNDKLRRDAKQGNFEIRLAGNDYVAFHFGLDVTEDDGRYDVATDMTLANDPIFGVGVVSDSGLGVLNVQVEAPESFLLPKPYLMTLEVDTGISGITDNRLLIDMLHQVGGPAYNGSMLMTLAVHLETNRSNLEGSINDLAVTSGLWVDDDFTKLGSDSEAMYTMNVAATTNAERALATYGVSQDVTVRVGMRWDKSQAGMSAAVNVAKVDLSNMGQFEDNSMSVQVRAFDADDSCVVDMQMCAQSNNANNVNSFNVNTAGQIRDNLRGSLTIRAAEFSANANSTEVMYVDSTSDYTRASDKMLGVKLTDIPAGDTVRMQMAVNMADVLALDEAYVRVKTSGDDVASDTTLTRMNSLSGLGGDTFPEQLVSEDLVGQCSLNTGNQPACEAFMSPTMSPTGDDPTDTAEPTAAPSAVPTATPTTAAPTSTPTGSPTRAPTSAPTSSPTFSGVFDVTATVTFSTLQISAFANTTYDTEFRSAYRAAVAAEATVSISQVAIKEITDGSVNVATVVTFDSLEAGDIAQAEEKAISFVAKLNAAPADIFKSSTVVDFGSFGVTVANVQKTELQSRTAAPTTASPTLSPTTTAPTMTAAAPTTAAPTAPTTALTNSATSSSFSSPSSIVVLVALVLVLVKLV